MFVTQRKRLKRNDDCKAFNAGTDVVYPWLLEKQTYDEAYRIHLPSLVDQPSYDPLVSIPSPIITSLRFLLKTNAENVLWPLHSRYIILQLSLEVLW